MFLISIARQTLVQIADCASEYRIRLVSQIQTSLEFGLFGLFMYQKLCYKCSRIEAKLLANCPNFKHLLLTQVRFQTLTVLLLKIYVKVLHRDLSYMTSCN